MIKKKNRWWGKIMKIWKIITIITITFLLIGIVSATDIDNLKVPDGWKSLGGGSYHEIGDSPGQGNGRNMMIQESSDSIVEEYTTNLTEDNYYAFKNTDNTWNYTDGSNQDSGCFEVVKIDGKDYFVVFSTADDVEFTSDTLTTYELMMEFNKLNNLDPVEI